MTWTLQKITLAALFVAVHGFAGEPPSDATNTPLSSVEALVAEALEKNPELTFYQAEIAAAKGGRKAAGRWANPELEGGVGQKTVRGSGTSDAGTAWAVSVVQPFEWPGRIGLRKAIANRDIELAEVGYERFKAALTARIRLVGHTLFAAQQKSAAANEVAERFKTLREVLVQRDPAGLTPLLEFRIIEAAELMAQRKTTEEALATQAALLELNFLRGVSPDASLSMAETHLSFRPLPPAEILLALARTNNFELRLRSVELAQQGLRVSLAKNERFPSLTIGPSVSEERAGERERIIGGGLSLPLPLWNRNHGHIDAAQARQMQAETSLLVTQREMERKVLQAAWSYETKMRQMAGWRADSVEHFKEAAEVADRHYRLGSVPISTYVELQDKYLEAVEGLLDTKKEALEAGQDIELLTGLTPPLVITAPVVPNDPR